MNANVFWGYYIKNIQIFLTSVDSYYINGINTPFS